MPADTLQWLNRHHKLLLLLPPPGCRVWMSGLMTTDIPASAQSGCL